VHISGDASVQCTSQVMLLCCAHLSFCAVHLIPKKDTPVAKALETFRSTGTQRCHSIDQELSSRAWVDHHCTSYPVESYRRNVSKSFKSFQPKCKAREQMLHCPSTVWSNHSTYLSPPLTCTDVSPRGAAWYMISCYRVCGGTRRSLPLPRQPPHCS
jgi:hypothetical protein